MKKIITLSCLMLLCSFAGMAQKFALIDMEYILKNIPAYEMTNEQLSQVSKKWQNEVEAIQQEKTIPTPMAGFTATDTVQGGAFSTTAQVPVLRLYQFLTTFTVQSGPDKGKPVLDGNAVPDKDFIRAVMRADYSTAYQNCVKGKMRCVITQLSKAYFKDWKEYRTAAARSIGLTAESLAKYNVEKPFISRLKELLPMIK